MPQNEIALLSTEPDFYYKIIGQVEVVLEAQTIFDDTPSYYEADQHLRLRASRVGGDAVIKVRYERDFSWTSWRRLTVSGIAVKKAVQGLT